MPMMQNLKEIEGKIEAACKRVKRDLSEIKIVAVGKTFDAGTLREAYSLGLRDFGENRVQEMLSKQAQLPSDIDWHMIGRLQTNKVRDILGKTALIHSLDRKELFAKIDNDARRLKIPSVKCLVQVNISREASKAGFLTEDLEAFLEDIPHDSPVKVQGLMTIGPLSEDSARIRTVFAQAKKLYDHMAARFSKGTWRYLSMGMSGDYEMAIEEGSTMLRIGTALFGSRS